ncbi:MAG: hypothetical protein K1Y01_20240 [Vicinamibacteria bacterium]|nr:hypothetical protein [Vicinamibacteria bacterium]
MNLRLHDAAEAIATRATLGAVRILARVLDSQLRRLRISDDALTQAVARIKELEARNGILTEMVETFQTRLRKIAPKKRPHYSGPARFRALQLRQTMGWSIEEAAAQFLVTPTTFTRWEDAADPARQTVGPDIQTDPPIRRYADVVRNLVRLAERLGMRRAHQIAAHVARGGWKISKSYVESVLRSEPEEASPDLPDSSSRMPLKARFVGHVFILDSHEVKNFLGFRKFFITGVFDAYSQAPLGIHASASPPMPSVAMSVGARNQRDTPPSLRGGFGRPPDEAIPPGRRCDQSLSHHGANPLAPRPVAWPRRPEEQPHHPRQLRAAALSPASVDRIRALFEAMIERGVRIGPKWLTPETGGEATIDKELRLVEARDPRWSTVQDLVKVAGDPKAIASLCETRAAEVAKVDTHGLIKVAVARFRLGSPGSAEEVRRALLTVAQNAAPTYSLGPEEQLALITSTDWHGRYVGGWHTHAPHDANGNWTGGDVPSFEDMQNAVQYGQYLTLSFQPDGFDLYDAEALGDAKRVDLALLKVIRYRSAEWREHFRERRSSVR